MGDQNYSQLQCNEEVLGPQRDHLYIVIPIISIYTVIFITGIVGNISTCIVIFKNKSMHTATNYYLFSLAISDLVLLLSGLPQEIYSIWSRYPYIFGGTFCFLHGLFAESSSNATVCTITAFTIERYLAICHPLRSRTMSKLSRAIKIILCIWSFSVFLAVPQAMQFRIIKNGDCEICHFVGPIIELSFEVSTLVFFLGPMTLITVLYVLIGLKLKSSNMMKRKNLTDRVQRKSSRKIIKMLVAVVVAFFICWAPFHIQRLFTKYSSGILDRETHPFYLQIYEIVTYVSGVLYYISATVNPILYNIMSIKFREAFKETFSWCCCLSSFKSHQRTYSALSRSAPASGSTGRESTESGKDENPTSHATLSQKESLQSLPEQSSNKRISCDGRNTEKMRREIEESYIDLSSRKGWSAQRCNYEMKICSSNPGKSIDILETQCDRKMKPSVTGCCLLFQKETKEQTDRRKNLNEYYARCLEENIFQDIKKIPADDYSDISNTSLKDIEGGAFEDELTTYIKICFPEST